MVRVMPGHEKWQRRLSTTNTIRTSLAGTVCICGLAPWVGGRVPSSALREWRGILERVR